MRISSDDLALLGDLIRDLYARPFSEELIAEAQRVTGRLTDSQYVSFNTFSLDHRHAPVLISNNPPDFIPVYLSVIQKDFLIDAIVSTGRDYVLSRDPMARCEDHQGFICPVQESRPISEISYTPMRCPEGLAGFCGMARAGLTGPSYSESELGLFRFITGFVGDAFNRSLLPPLLAEDVAFLDVRGNVAAAGDRIEATFHELFDSGRAAGRERRDVFRGRYRMFLRGPFRPGMDRVTIHAPRGRYAFLFSLLRPKELCLPFDGGPYASVRLLAAPSGVVEVPVLDLSAAARVYGLTPRECDVIRGVYAAKSNKVIARELGIDESTVKRHTHNIYEKTGLRSRVELVQRLMAGPP
ncbi:MAG TPA: helix-turn-helix transcriptional regulator [Spirochaetia bacterium]